MDKNQIVDRALAQLGFQTGLLTNWKTLSKEEDGELDIMFGKTTVSFFAAIKKEVRQYQLAQLFELAETHHQMVVIANNISPNLRERLREKKIGYLDTAGNVYINANDVYLFIDGKKSVEKIKPVTNRAFTKTGSKTVFFLLLQENNINLPHRKIAEMTNVSVGNIKNIIEGLRDAGFIMQTGTKQMQLRNKEELLDRWIFSYRETLKPSLKLGHFRFWDEKKRKSWDELSIEQGESAWSGEPAAAYITKYMRPETLTLYTNKSRAHFVSQWSLVPDEKGYVQLYEKFWKDKTAKNSSFAPPLLIYADLLLTDDPRCIEVANLIYTEFLEHEFGSNKKR